MNRIVRDLILILLILIIPVWLMELLEIDVSLQKLWQKARKLNDSTGSDY